MALPENLSACRKRLLSDVELFDREVRTFSRQLKRIYVPGPTTTVLEEILRVRRAALSAAQVQLSSFDQRMHSLAQM